MSPTSLNMDLLASVFNHLVLPPAIPGTDDTAIDDVSYDITLRMIHATETAMNITGDAPWVDAFTTLHHSLRACLELNGGRLDRASLLSHFQTLHSDQVLILNVKEQNAGLLVRRDTQ
jgi:hypothetical protein